MIKREIAVFGGGCYWCTEAVFKMLKGVSSVMPGFSGGKKENPTYEEVCDDTTGHAEVIRIEYDTITLIAIRALRTVRSLLTRSSRKFKKNLLD
jgi:methionine-S-sulfoxide reductase